MTNQQPFIPAVLVNTAKLRELALERAGTVADQPVTLLERVVVAILVNREVKSPTHPLMDTMREDLQTWNIPKYTALVGWLAPYSLVSQYPSAVSRVAQYLLGTTRDLEHASIDWEAVRYHYPQLKPPIW
jgi:hypothetical protein